MPSNWFSLHPIQSRKSHEAIIERAERKADGFIEKILTNKKVWVSINNLYEIIWGTLLSVISVAYLFIGRFFLAKLFFANNNCDGCGLCARSCSVKAIKMWGQKHPKPFWKYNCESCMRCAAFCPRNAIEAGHSWGVVLYFVSAVPISAYIFSWFDVYISGSGNLKEHWIGDIFDLIYYYPAIFISFSGIILSLICIYALTNRTIQPLAGIAYSSSGALVLSVILIVLWKNWASKRPQQKAVRAPSAELQVP